MPVTTTSVRTVPDVVCCEDIVAIPLPVIELSSLSPDPPAMTAQLHPPVDKLTDAITKSLLALTFVKGMTVGPAHKLMPLKKPVTTTSLPDMAIPLPAISHVEPSPGLTFPLTAQLYTPVDKFTDAIIKSLTPEVVKVVLPNVAVPVNQPVITTASPDIAILEP
jgi:hypothetical protein